MIGDSLEELGVTVVEAAKVLGVTGQRLQNVIAGGARSGRRWPIGLRKFSAARRMRRFACKPRIISPDEGRAACMKGGELKKALENLHELHRLHISCKNHVIEMIKMIRVAAAEFQRNIGRYQDLALTQPVAVTRNGRERTVLISAEEYERLRRRDRQVLGLEDFTEDDISALERTSAPESSKAFDHELKS